MAEIRLEWEGITKAIRKFAELPDNAIKAAGVVLYQEGEKVMTKSKRIVPVDTGTLRASGTVFPAQIKRDTVEVLMGYGGAASAYAVIQHERTDLNHPGQGQAKYLESVVDASAASIARALGSKYKSVLR